MSVFVSLVIVCHCLPTLVLTEQGQGQTDDFYIDDNDLIIRQTRGDELVLTFRVDSVALEPDETFQIQLSSTPPPPAGDNVFFLNTLNVTIEDPDGNTTLIFMYFIT